MSWKNCGLDHVFVSGVDEIQMGKRREGRGELTCYFLAICTVILCALSSCGLRDQWQ